MVERVRFSGVVEIGCSRFVFGGKGDDAGCREGIEGSDCVTTDLSSTVRLVLLLTLLTSWLLRPVIANGSSTAYKNSVIDVTSTRLAGNVTDLGLLRVWRQAVHEIVSFALHCGHLLCPADDDATYAHVSGSLLGLVVF